MGISTDKYWQGNNKQIERQTWVSAIALTSFYIPSRPTNQSHGKHGMVTMIAESNGCFKQGIPNFVGPLVPHLTSARAIWTNMLEQLGNNTNLFG